MMKKNTFFSDKIWFEYLKVVVEELQKEKEKIKITEIIKKLWIPKNDSVKAV